MNIEQLIPKDKLIDVPNPEYSTIMKTLYIIGGIIVFLIFASVFVGPGIIIIFGSVGVAWIFIYSMFKHTFPRTTKKIKGRVQIEIYQMNKFAVIIQDSMKKFHMIPRDSISETIDRVDFGDPVLFISLLVNNPRIELHQNCKQGESP